MSTASTRKAKERQFRALFEREGLTPGTISLFQQLIWGNYRTNGRAFPWRQTREPYHILVSEIMLQQTQTSRVLKKYEEFIAAFPDFPALAAAPLIDVLQVWLGLGYNRRAIALHRTAQRVVSAFNGELPSSAKTLEQLPGIGSYTASAVAAIAFNRPATVIDTNIRTVFTYFFLHNREEITDREILPLVNATMDRTNPREWYYALFDYGALLKSRIRLNEKSVHYRKQSAFQGSNREMRGRILRVVLKRSPIAEHELIKEVRGDPSRVRKSIRQLQREGFLTTDENIICVK